jgi:hypothetical protein
VIHNKPSTHVKYKQLRYNKWLLFLFSLIRPQRVRTVERPIHVTCASLAHGNTVFYAIK